MSEIGKGFIKCYIVMLSLFITVTSSQHRFRNDHRGNRTTALKDNDKWVWGYEEHPKPKNDEWIWGYVDPEPTTPTANTTIHNEKIKKLCSPYNPPKPKFNAKERRISDAKCYEYIWELKTRHKRHLKSVKCALELNKNSDSSIQQNVEVIRGREAVPGEFPHMVRHPQTPKKYKPHVIIGTTTAVCAVDTLVCHAILGAIGWQASSGTWVFKCGSSLISSKFVLTAGHCSRASDRDTSIADPVPKIVRLGDKNIIDVYTNGVPPTDAKIINIIVHPKYHPPKKYYDIALMELEGHVAFSKYIQPACLWTRFDTSIIGKEATLTGWGVVETIGRTTSPDLQAAVVDIIDTTTCDRLLKPSCNRNWCGVRDNQICAGKLAGGVDACQGDSGGPLQVPIPLPISSEGGMHYVVGVTSFGIGCALPNLPGIYSRASMYLDWIESVVWPML